MPRVDDRLLRATVFVYGDVGAALLNKSEGGAGALLRLGTADNSRHVVVTNSHVVAAGGHTIKIFADTGWIAETVEPDRWHHAVHDDLAVAQLDCPALRDLEVLSANDLIPTGERLAELNVGVGDDVIMVGRLAAQARPEHRPVLAFGNIVSWPAEPTYVGQLERDVFLAEMRSFGGDSGAPVFVHIPPGSYRGHRPGETSPTMMPFFDETIGLIGIVSGHLTWPARVLDKQSRPTGDVVLADAPVALVIPFDRVRALLEEADLF